MRAEAELRSFTEQLAQPDRWIARLRIQHPKTDAAEALKELRAARDKAAQVYADRRREAKKMGTLFPYEATRAWEWFRDHAADLTSEACPTLEGGAQTRLAVVESIIESPRDGNTDSDYNATIFDPPTGSYHSLMFEHWIEDQTSYFAADAPDLMWVISHLGYEFPAAPM